MKPISIYSLVILSLAALSLRTAASAPDAHSEVPAGSHHKIEAAQKSAAGKTAHRGAARNAFAVADSASHAATDGTRVLSPRDAARFHRATATASRRFSREMDPVNAWAARVKAVADATAEEPATMGQYSHQLQEQLSIYKKVLKQTAALILIETGKINKNIAALAVEHDVKKATANCQAIRTYAENIIAFYRRDHIDEKGLKLVVDGSKLVTDGNNLISAGHTTAGNKLVEAGNKLVRAGNALVIRGARIENGTAVLTPLQNLVTTARSEAQAFQAISAATSKLR